MQRRSFIFCSRVLLESNTFRSSGIRFNSTIQRNNTSTSISLRYYVLGGFLAGSMITTGLFLFANQKKKETEVFPDTSTTKLQDCEEIKYGDSQLAIKRLIEALGPSKITTNHSELEIHSDSAWSSDRAKDDERHVAIVYPESTEDVSTVSKICHELRVPIVPFTGGTSLEGHFISTRNGICVDMSRMDKIVELHAEDLDIVVQPAVGWENLRNYLEEYNLMFGPDPGPGACIGGMVATSCSGTNAARYGTMRENVISVTVVLPDGTVIKTKRRPRKSSAGYNLTNLIIGSEGTLGIVTEVTLKLYVRPKFENIAMVSFENLKDAAGSVAKFVQEGLQLNAIELLDDRMMSFINYSGLCEQKYDECPTLLLKIGGSSEEVVNSLTKTVKNIVKSNNSKTFKFASNEEEKFQLWNARKVILWSTIQYGKDNIDPNVQVWTTDVAVPISKFVESLEATKAEIDKSGLNASIVGHAGDGNYHACILYKESQREIACNLVEGMIERAIELDGTVTGEHGIGIGKKEYLLHELGQDPVDMMRKIKFALDPHKIMNPDKIFAIDPVNDRTI